MTVNLFLRSVDNYENFEWKILLQSEGFSLMLKSVHTMSKKIFVLKL